MVNDREREREREGTGNLFIAFRDAIDLNPIDDLEQHLPS